MFKVFGFSYLLRVWMLWESHAWEFCPALGISCCSGVALRLTGEADPETEARFATGERGCGRGSRRCCLPAPLGAGDCSALVSARNALRDGSDSAGILLPVCLRSSAAPTTALLPLVCRSLSTPGAHLLPHRVSTSLGPRNVEGDRPPRRREV